MGDSPTIRGFVVHVQEKKMFSIAREVFLHFCFLLRCVDLLLPKSRHPRTRWR